jgi:hypothetical protein
MIVVEHGTLILEKDLPRSMSDEYRYFHYSTGSYISADPSVQNLVRNSALTTSKSVFNPAKFNKATILVVELKKVK